MQFSTLIAAIATVAIGTTDAAAIRRDGARLAQFRVFGADGCSALNYGFYTVDQSDVGTCNSLTTDPSAVISVHLEALYPPAADGCTVSVFTDTACTTGQTAISVDACTNIPVAGENWSSWQITC
ncbi:hypothetical protein F5Y12DRAFT_389831 [Xylaria sp. FL1777]|nr:hypothetical protein F5Y12DRAFT_389831 [Xylaria sp. FL1777]